MNQLPKTWRYNVKELRLEKSVPAYGEDEEYIGHVWAAVVPEDVLQLIHEEKNALLDRLERLLEQPMGEDVPSLELARLNNELRLLVSELRGQSE